MVDVQLVDVLLSGCAGRRSAVDTDVATCGNSTCGNSTCSCGEDHGQDAFESVSSVFGEPDEKEVEAPFPLARRTRTQCHSAEGDREEALARPTSVEKRNLKRAGIEAKTKRLRLACFTSC